MTTPTNPRSSNAAFALAVTAATVISVGTVVLVTQSNGGSGTRAAAATISGTSPAGGALPGAPGAPSPTGASSLPTTPADGSAASSDGAVGPQDGTVGPQSSAGSGSDASGPGGGASGGAPSNGGPQPSSSHGAPQPSGSDSPQPPAPTTKTKGGSATGLDDPHKKEIAMELVSSAENSSLDWRAQYKYIEDIHDGRGYTAGIIGFCSGTGDMLQVVQRYATLEPGNILAKYLGALKSDNGSASHHGLDPNFTKDWVKAAADPKFQQAQNDILDSEYFNPAVNQAKADGLGTLGQFIYYDAMVMHGPGSDPQSFGGIRAAALRKAKPPSQGGDEIKYLNAYLDARVAAMKADPSHQDTSRVDTEQRLFVKAGNLNLDTPLHWRTYGDPYTIN